MENYVAEVAISFDQPYTLKEIQTKIPDNLNIVWLYMVSPIRDESGGPAGMPVYGFEPEPLSKNRTKGSLIPLNNIMMGMTRTFKVFKIK